MVGQAVAVLMSAKKDALTNIGGFVAISEDEEARTAGRRSSSCASPFPGGCTQARQLDQAGDATPAVVEKVDDVRGLEMISEAPVLRHFTVRFRTLSAG